MAGAVIEPTVHSPDFDAGILEHLLSRAADVTILVDATTGSPLRRWHDPHHSRLPVADSEARVISWVHPDDLPGILDARRRRKGFQMEKRFLHRVGHEVWAGR